MADKHKKNKIPSLEERKKEHELRLEELRRINELKGSPELFLNDKSSDQYLDALGLKIKLIGGIEFTLEECLDKDVNVYHPIFYKDYFTQVGRLLNISKEQMDKYYKPRSVAMFTLQFLYARFPHKDLIRILRRRSPWSRIFGQRKYKLFQHLSKSALEQLKNFIDQSVNMMKGCETFEQFRDKYCTEYKLSFQVELF